MKIKSIDNLNIVLILLSLVLAYVLPFSLFLFSYAVLGPLHYLTEINWLNKKNYFIKERKWIWVLVVITALISIPVIMHIPFLSGINNHPIFKNFSLTINGLTDVFLLAALFFAIGLVYLKKWQHLLIYLIISIVVAKLITKYVLFSYILVGLFLPTIIHVYIFTLLFMIMGSLNTKNKAGWIGVIVLVISPLLIFIAPINSSFYTSFESNEVVTTARNFRFIQYLTETYDKSANGHFSILSIKIQVFIAFCYTYHYLNWFSKTSIIKWHKNVSKVKLSIILSLWLCLIVLFWYNYETAYLALFFLAMLHIVLEFPLNVTSIKEIVLRLKSN
ncbi:MAG: hypothetical protein SFY56_13110 [Bacteroidota bacterium]|nr:hypothetical protein [Bacteroidota bacterium]